MNFLEKNAKKKDANVKVTAGQRTTYLTIISIFSHSTQEYLTYTIVASFMVGDNLGRA